MSTKLRKMRHPTSYSNDWEKSAELWRTGRKRSYVSKKRIVRQWRNYTRNSSMKLCWSRKKGDCELKMLRSRKKGPIDYRWKWSWRSLKNISLTPMPTKRTKTDSIYRFRQLFKHSFKTLWQNNTYPLNCKSGLKVDLKHKETLLTASIY